MLGSEGFRGKGDKMKTCQYVVGRTLEGKWFDFHQTKTETQ